MHTERSRWRRPPFRASSSTSYEEHTKFCPIRQDLDRTRQVCQITTGAEEGRDVDNGAGRVWAWGIVADGSQPATTGDQGAVVLPAGLWPQSLGETLRLLRHRARISRDQLAARAGVSAGAVSNYENDVSMPPALTLRRVCSALGTALGRPSAELWEQLGVLLDHFDEDPRRTPR
jgi:DNA-binding XRE family transcriptional regulator